MALKFYNTLTRKKELLKPRKGNKVDMFICGPTVYNYSHLGHAKTYLQFDIIVKYLRYRKYKVFYLQNITDIDDKIIKKALDENINTEKIARKYETEYYKDMKVLGINSVNKYARATDHIKEIINQVQGLMNKGFAYKIDDGIYFDLSKFKDYGKLSGRTTLEAEDSVSRIDDNKDKRNKGDFCLWKFSKENEPSWKNPFGKTGRPGWHIEDTAITEKYFGQQYDIHGGARDLIFPHHEAEIAQMESLSGKKPFVKYWLHTGFLNIESNKMSKSLGNFLTIREVLEKHDAKTLRFFYILTHYRSPIDFSEENLRNAENSLRRINDFVLIAKKSKEKADKKIIEKAKKKFIEAMDDDIDTPKAFAVLFDFMKEINKKGTGKNVYEFFSEIDKIFGILNLDETELTKEEEKLIKARENARKKKDYGLSDKIRQELNKKHGIILEDTSEGIRWKRQK
nr:cysteine--tRNA ligase [Candidatus Woesearchaeota archaeon]